MQYEKYKEFVINYKPFEWEINFSDFRENIKGKHSFIINFICMSIKYIIFIIFSFICISFIHYKLILNLFRYFFG